MENAAKALTMAGSVLLAVMIITVLVFGYGKLNETSDEKEKAKIIEQIVEFNKEFESYNRKDVYGAELLSLINKIEDYNKKVNDYQEGYSQITGNVTFVIEWNGIKPRLTIKISELISKIKDIEEAMNKIEKDAGGQYKMEQIVGWYEKEKDLTRRGYMDEATEYSKKITKAGFKTKEQIEDYVTKKDLLTDLKRRYFKCSNVEYDDEKGTKTGRIIRMDFQEIDTTKLN